MITNIEIAIKISIVAIVNREKGMAMENICFRMEIIIQETGKVTFLQEKGYTSLKQTEKLISLLQVIWEHFKKDFFQDSENYLIFIHQKRANIFIKGTGKMEKDKDLENSTIMEMKISIMWEIGIMIKEMDKDQI